MPRATAVPLAWVVYPWLGLALYLFLFTLFADIGRGLAALVGGLPKDPERRQFLARAIAAGVAGAAAVLGIGGAAVVASGFVVRRVRVPLAKLPKSASGYRIVQMTDVHVGPTIGRDFVESIVRESNALAPDMVVITGDLVDGSVEQLGHLVEPLRDLKARDGVFFVTGNHEYYSGADAWIAFLTTLGIRVLRNERVPIRDAFDLAGVDDSSAARSLAHHGQDIAGAVQGRDPSRALVLLAHQPKAVRQALPAGRGSPAIRARARRPDGAVQLDRAARPAVHQGSAPGGADVALRLRRHVGELALHDALAGVLEAHWPRARCRSRGPARRRRRPP